MDLVKLYDNRSAVPDHPAIIAGWQRDAAAFRNRVRADLDAAYGARPRSRIDVFHPPVDRGGPLVVFIHGGYWRTFDKSMFSHMAAGPAAHGLTVAVAGYTLCPDVSVLDIIDELRQCCLFLAGRYGRPLVVTGHSAGGHLAACVAATDWRLLGQAPAAVRACLAISGVFDLRPLLATPYNEDLKLSPVDALAASPLLWPVGQRFAAELWVGQNETTEFLRQSASLAAAWQGIGLDTRLQEVPGANHFSIVAELAKPDSPMTLRLAEVSYR